ncbi:VOC family protein [Nocardioides alcanivorans]|uniref:VOC family protein n=1 Tax=Nocardioides alcanivorans TaxID=2897352 RepID=UPI001F18B00E|nr:VOC family protein [Nocardioides alcanivorans]
MSVLNPYLCFRGQAAAAIDFYQSVFGGEVTRMTFADMGGMGLEEEEQGWIMHSQLTTPDGQTLMCSDTPVSMSADDIRVAQIALSGAADEEPTLRAWFDRLGEGGEVHVPLEKAPWGDWFGQCADPFGHIWMVNIAGDQG